MAGTETKFICIHGHFYQPPRENPWLETIEIQDEASPFHDWNERINEECYAPNSNARILDEKDNIVDIVNNYEHISFNFGPTLLSWLELSDPVTYQKIMEADRKSIEKNNGHGNAIAQVYSHLILPLANQRDQETQVIWGIKDFEYRFGRRPEGMWLAETAVDTPTLEILARHGILFTILAPSQAKMIRNFGDNEWKIVAAETLDTRVAYTCKLPSGNQISLFFYNGGISQEVAFNSLLNSGNKLYERLTANLKNNQENGQLVHIATDGETYGHHHRFGEMALADCIRRVQKTEDVTITNYGAFLAQFPPQTEVIIRDNSAWSCTHGVERWRSDCGCSTGGEAGWNQQWRAPLRAALDWLSDELKEIFESLSIAFLVDPWDVRNDYIQLILDRNPEGSEAFFSRNCTHDISQSEKTKLLQLLEMQRHAMLMYTSCGWFFNEVSGIETIQILQYAMRAIDLAKEVSSKDLLPEFSEKLKLIPSNKYENGLEIFEKFVLPAKVNLEDIACFYAAGSLFEAFPEVYERYSCEIRQHFLKKANAGKFFSAIGQATVTSKITQDEMKFTFWVSHHVGRTPIHGYLFPNLNPEVLAKDWSEIFDLLGKSEFKEVLNRFIAPAKGSAFSIATLFLDGRRWLVDRVLELQEAEVDSGYREIFEANEDIMSGFLDQNIPVPDTYRDAAKLMLNRKLSALFLQRDTKVKQLKDLAATFEKWGIRPTQNPALERHSGEWLLQKFLTVKPSDDASKPYEDLLELLQILQHLCIQPKLRKLQNAIFEQGQKIKNSTVATPVESWWSSFFALADHLKIKLTEDPN